jgi:hypothetical protein
MAGAPTRCYGLSSERNASLPWNEILLYLHLSFGMNLAAGHFDNKVENNLAHLLDCLLSRNNFPSVDVDDVVHPLGQS